MAHILPSTTFDTCTDGTMTCLAQWAYTVTQGMFWVFALFGFCVAVFFATTRLGNVRAFGYAGFVGLVGSIWFAVMGFMDWGTASLFIIVGIIGLAAMINSNN